MLGSSEIRLTEAKEGCFICCDSVRLFGSMGAQTAVLVQEENYLKKLLYNRYMLRYAVLQY